MPKELFEAADEHPLDDHTCFLCGVSLSADNRTDEDVFPQWLLHKFDLWNKRLTLLNGTTIPYRQIRIPCCGSCNNNHLSKLENRIKQKLFSQDFQMAPQVNKIYFFGPPKYYLGFCIVSCIYHIRGAILEQGHF